MAHAWPNLQVLELFVAVVDEGSVASGARKLGMAQSNASRSIAELEADLKTPLLERSPRGSAPTAMGLLLADSARELLEAARRFNSVVRTGRSGETMELSVGASLTIADMLLPAWLAELKRRLPHARIDVRVENSAAVIEEVQRGTLQLGFVETPNLPVRVNALVVREDELVVVVDPNHEWANRTRISLQELAEIPLVVREPGSGTREALQEVLAGYDVVEPAQVLSSNTAVRVAVAAGAGPAVLSELVVRDQLASGELLRVPFEGEGISRPLTAIWSGPRRLTGVAAELVAVAAGRA
ncbi:LysR family transcriptional regulator [Arthrobacter sp. zg-Y1219]|uniref:LysR family transcriptional regulator n=1 Tax=Arthrobacter sp. zg-Y1219 TaxID=3049067 RepID=UPI0024C21060|nr:LysR family transcriptional regulator [Arthrobacter sp. zg-Y1219]MDK1361575.1 LysR family transcriptional regulator [Arthrobacter sp. zg-Y1219]